MQRIKKKILYFIVGALFLLCAVFAFSSPLTSRADADAETKPLLRAEIIKRDTAEKYFYFSDPTAIYANSSSLFVADGGKILSFNISDFSHVATVDAAVPNIAKFAVTATKYIFLSGEKLYWTNPAATSPTNTLLGEFSDFTVMENKLFCLSSSGVSCFDISETAIEKNTTDDFSSLNFGAQTCKNISAASGKIYLSTTSERGNSYTDVLLITPSEAFAWGIAASTTIDDIILDLAARSATDTLLCQTRDKIIQLSPKGNGLITGGEYDANSLKKLCQNDAGIYALSYSDSVVSLDKNMAKTDILLGKADKPDFYNLPRSAVSRKGNLYVADEFNNRVSIVSPDKTTILADNFYRPNCVAVDYLGQIYVAHNFNEVSVYSAALNKIKHFSTDYNIIDIKIDSNNNLYILSDNGALYELKSGETASQKLLELQPPRKIISFDVSLSGVNCLYAMSSDKTIFTIIDGKETKLFDFTLTALDFFVDHDASVYILDSSGKITKYEKTADSYALKFDALAYEPSFSVSGGASAIIMSANDTASLNVSYGDIIVIDTKVHALKRIDGKAFEVNANFTLDSSPTIPDSDTPTPLDPTNTRIIYSVKEDCEVYSVEAEISPIARLSGGMKIIVPQFDAAKKFNLIIADNVSSGAEPAIVGYMYTALILQAQKYTSKHPLECHTFIANVSIYKFPTRNCAPLSQYRKLDKDYTLKLLDFCYTGEGAAEKYGYTDNFSAKAPSINWYRVSFGENNQFEGYVASDFVSVLGANPDPQEFPQTNAQIISKDKNNDKIGAVIYKNEDGKFTPLDEQTLAVGTKVEVIGAFDSSKPYTQIKYHNGYGAVTVWVETANLQYNGVNVVQVVAIIITIVTLILLALVIWRVLYQKSHRLKD